LRILSINSDFGSLENIETNYEMSRERIKISDNIKKKDITTFLLDRQQAFENNSFMNANMYEAILNFIHEQRRAFMRADIEVKEILSLFEKNTVINCISTR
jgi:hypothetical protein